MTREASAQQQVENLLRIARRWRWYGILTAGLILPLGLAYAYLTPTTYTVAATVSVEEDNVGNPLLGDFGAGTAPGERLAVVQESVHSWALLQKTAEEIGPEAVLADSPQLLHFLKRSVRDRLVQEGDAATSAAVGRMQSAIHLQQRGRGIVEIRYTGLDPKLGARIVNATVANLLQQLTVMRSRGAEETVEFIREQLQTYKQRLEESEAAVRAFQEEHLQALPTQFGGHLASLAEARSELVSTEISLREARNRIEFLEAQLTGMDSNVVTARKTNVNPTVQRIQDQITAAKVELAGLRTNYTERHPRIMELKQRIKDLEEAAKAETQRTVTEETLAANPLYEQLQQRLHEARVDRESLELRQQALEDRITNLEAAVRTIPGQEQDLARLTRDNAVNESIYNLLLNKLEQAKISQQMMRQQRGPERFRVIEPARPSQASSGPDRTVLAALAFIAALGGGIGAILIRQFFDESFDNAEQLTSAFEIPCLAIIPPLDKAG